MKASAKQSNKIGMTAQELESWGSDHSILILEEI